MLISGLGDAAELRLLEMRHAPAYHRLVCDNLDRLYWVTSAPSETESTERVKKGLERLLDASGVNGGIFDQGELCGVAGLFHVNTDFQSGEIGYWIARQFEGRGLVTKACAAILDYGFRDLQLHRIELRCAASNTRSIQVAERLGFRREGCLIQADRVGGGWVDFLIYGLLASEWRGRGQHVFSEDGHYTNATLGDHLSRRP